MLYTRALSTSVNSDIEWPCEKDCRSRIFERSARARHGLGKKLETLFAPSPCAASIFKQKEFSQQHLYFSEVLRIHRVDKTIHCSFGHTTMQESDLATLDSDEMS